MKNITKKIMNEMKIIGASLIPGACFTRKYQKMLSKNNKSATGTISYSTLNIIMTSLEMTSLLFVADALNHGEIDYRKWSQIDEQKEIQRISDYQNSRRNQFYELDINKDGFVDPTEFIYRKIK